MDNLEDIIFTDINKHIACHHLDVQGDGQHFEACVVSDEFSGKTKLERHRLVYQALGSKMGTQIHALSLKIYTQQEWSDVNG